MTFDFVHIATFNKTVTYFIHAIAIHKLATNVTSYIFQTFSVIIRSSSYESKQLHYQFTTEACDNSFTVLIILKICKYINIYKIQKRKNY